MTPLALYIHVPYCLEKCPYCDFHSVSLLQKELPSEQYAKVLIRQLSWETEQRNLQGRKLISIFFGGGTPSLMPPLFFQMVLEAITRHFAWDMEIEITVETNPATASLENFREWKRLGINRISFGVQSFDERMLKKLGRRHSAQDAKTAILQAKEAGFQNISLDLIFGIEGQTEAMLKNDLRTALRFDLPHLSAYQLTVEPNTPLFHWVNQKTFQLPDEEILGAMHQTVPAVLESRGLKRYEISNYAKEGFESRHNLQYWRYQDYLGIGSGAVSFVNPKRWRTTRKLKNYLAQNWDYEDEETIDPTTALKEKWMMGLRLREGVGEAFFSPSDNFLNSPLLASWGEKGAFVRKCGRLKLTPFGFLWYNQIVQDFFEMIDREEEKGRKAGCYEEVVGRSGSTLSSPLCRARTVG